MADEQAFRVGRHDVTLVLRDGVGPPTPYSLLLAEHIPQLEGGTAVDLGSGSGFLAIVARLQGAASVYLLDTNAQAVALSLENAERNGVREGMVPLATGAAMLPLPDGERVDLIISNPAQLPLPERDREDSPFYAGPDGRSMIEGLLREAPDRLAPGGRLVMTHNSLTDFPRSLKMMQSAGLEPRVLAERKLAFRPFIDRAWIDHLGGVQHGLYELRDGVPTETLYVVEARSPA
ncbi:MAG: methyltransferase [Geminicoccaceae bacterium]